MKILVFDTKQEVSEFIANKVIDQVQKKPDTVLGLATGSTPKEAYRYIKNDYKQNNRDYSKVITFNLDEYLGVLKDSINSYRQYMKEALFEGINIPNSQQYFPLKTNMKNYDNLIKEHGGVDLQLLGIGLNGHIAFNEPGSSFQSKTRIIELDESTRKRNSKYFRSIDHVPTQAISMGISTIMKAKEIILAATSEVKADIIKQLVDSNINENLPASILKTHENFTLVLDQEAARDIN